MMRVIFIFAFGLSVGYWVGFKDAKTHRDDIVVRMVNRAGGQTRNDVRTDVDGQMTKVEQDSDR